MPDEYLNWTEEIIHGVRVFVDNDFAASFAQWQKGSEVEPQTDPKE